MAVKMPRDILVLRHSILHFLLEVKLTLGPGDPGDPGDPGNPMEP